MTENQPLTVNELIRRSIAGESVSDTELREVGEYGWTYYNPQSMEEWDPFQELARRWRALNATPAPVPDINPPSEFREDAGATTQPCARCGATDARWIPGAGEALCARHQDDY